MSRPVRTLLAAIVLAALIVTSVAIVVPLIARPMIVAAVQGASPFGDQHLDIEVECNVFALVQGTVDRIHVHGTDLRRGDATVGALDLTFTDVATSGHAFGGAAGTLATIQIPIDDATGLSVDDVHLDGASTNLAAVATLDRAAAIRLVESALAEGGVDVSGVELGNGTVAFQVFGTRAEVPVGVENGALVLVDPFGQGSFEILTPSSKDGWRFTGAGVTPSAMTIEASLDADKLLASTQRTR
jgi:hypothetical protein